MKVHQIFTNSPLRNFSYLIEGEENLYCIDPYYPEQILNKVQSVKKNLRAVINTHEHWDHHCGNREVVAATHCEVWAHPKAEGKIPALDRLLKHGESISIDGDGDGDGEGKNELIVMDTPGHTFAHLCLLLKSSGRALGVFTGDTLFNAGVGNCYNGGDPEVLYRTISGHFQTLPDEVLLYPGHEYMENNLLFTLDRDPKNVAAEELLKTFRQHGGLLMNDFGIEKKVNVFLRADKSAFLRLRRFRDQWSV